MGTDPYQRLLDESRLAEATGRRSRERWMATQLAEAATFAGVLGDLLDRGEVVSLHTVAGATRIGALLAVGQDHVLVGTAGGERVLVALAAVADVRPAPSATHGPAGSDRPALLDRTLPEALGRLAEDRPLVQVHHGSTAVRGRLEAVGRDVVSLRLEGEGGRRALVRLGAIDEVVVGG